MVKAFGIALLTVCLIASAYARVEDVMGTWKQDLSKTEGLCAEMLIDIGANPIILESAKVNALTATLRYTEEGVSFYQTLPDGTVITDGETSVPISHPVSFVMPGGLQYGVFDETEDGFTAFVHLVGTDIYFDESFAIAEDGKMIRKFLAYRTGRSMTHVYDRVEDKEEL